MQPRIFSQEQIEDLQALRKDALAYKARMKIKEKAEKGIQHGCAPLGYKNVIVNGEKLIVPDPDTAPKVKLLFKLASKKGMTIRKLVPLAAEVGLKSRSGKLLGASSIHLILNNPFYIGLLRKGRHVLKGAHRSVVSEDEFRKSQHNLSANRRF